MNKKDVVQKILDLYAKIKAKGYQIIIGNNILYRLPKEINKNCSKCKKVAIIVDKKVQKGFC